MNGLANALSRAFATDGASAEKNMVLGDAMLGDVA